MDLVTLVPGALENCF